MKTLVRAFSLVELLLVVTILSIVSVVGFTSFSRLSSWGQSGEITGKISNNLRELDEMVSAKKINSYEVVFEKWAAGYIVNLPDSTSSSWSLSINWTSGVGTLHVESAAAGDWAIPFFADNKILRTAVFSGTVNDFEFRLPQTPVSIYKIQSLLGGTLQNTFEIHSFSSYGLTGERGIWAVSGLPGATTKVVIRNNRGNRTITDGDTLSIVSGWEIEISNNGKTANFRIP